MSYDLTGQKVSFTYGNLLQYVDGSFYNGFGVPVPITDISSLTEILVNYTPNSSLGDSFYWDASGFLEVSTGASGAGYVLKTGDTMSGRLNVPDISTNYVYFKPSTFVTAPGKLGYDVDERTLSFGLPGNDGTIQIGKETFEYYKNDDVSILYSGDVVSITGASGANGLVKRTDPKFAPNAFAVVGMVTNGPVALNGFARVTKIGTVHDLNTSAWAEGTALYVDPANKGKLTSTVPPAPNIAIIVGIVTRSNTNTGIINVTTTAVQKLTNLSDVDGFPLTSTGQFPVWHSDTSVFDFDYNIQNYLPNASLGSDFYWLNGYLYADVSVIAGGVAKIYVDGSLADIRAKYIPDSSLGDESFYWDASHYLQTSAGGGTGIGGKWKYKDVTTDADPGNGYFNMNTVDPSLATFIYTNNFTVTGTDISNILKSLSPGDRFYVQELPSSSVYGVYYLTSQVIDAGTYIKLPVTAEKASGTFSKNKESGFLFLYTGGTQPTVVDPSLDYQTYVPRVSDVSFYYDLNANVTNIISQSDIGQKTVDFVYNEIGDVSVISINNYGLNQRQVTFEQDLDGNIIAVHIT